MDPSPFLQPYHLWKIAADPLGFLRHMTSTYGDVVRFRVGLQRVILLSGPRHVRELLVEKHRSFSKTRSVRMLGTLLGEGLLTSEGEHHDRMRTLIRPVLRRSDVARYTDAIVEQTIAVSTRLRRRKFISCFDVGREISLRIICRTMFGHTDPVMESAFLRAADCAALIYKRSLNPLAPLLAMIPNRTTRTIRDASAELDMTIDKLIERVEQRGVSKSHLLEVLLTPDHGLTHRQIRDEIVTVIATGHETTAVALAWLLYIVAGRPKDAERIRTDGQSAKDFTLAFVMEVLRLYPPVYAFGRRAREECLIGDLEVRKNDVIHVSPYLLHRDPRHFHNPEVFRPERWLHPEEDIRNTDAYIPFGTGPRGCPGENLAFLELSTVVRVLLHEWQFARSNGHEPLFAPTITLRPKDPLEVRVTKRKSESDDSCEEKERFEGNVKGLYERS